MAGLYKEIRTEDGEDDYQVDTSLNWRGPRHSAFFHRHRNTLVVLALVIFVACILPWTLLIYKGLAATGSKKDGWDDARLRETILKGQSELSASLSLSNVAILLKTGASVINQRLPVHLHHEYANRSDLRLQLYSDYPQTIDKLEVIDILRNQPDVIRDQHDFQPYEVQKAQLNVGVPVDQLDGAWSLDKYKFIPMMADAYKRFPDVSWFVVVEADTYLFIDNMLRYLSTMHHNGQTLLGNPVLIEDWGVYFAHGGSGFALSRGLMDATFGQHADYVEHTFDNFIGGACCGDEVLARALFSAPGIHIKAPEDSSINRFSGETPTSARFSQDTWCAPIMTFHHIGQKEVERLWAFEERLFPRLLPGDMIRYIDIFQEFAPLFITSNYTNKATQVVMEGWENRAEDVTIQAEEGTVFDADFCSLACEHNANCYQWQFRHDDQGNECILSDRLVRIGAERQGFTSGWRLDRLRMMRQDSHCENRPMLDEAL